MNSNINMVNPEIIQEYIESLTHQEELALEIAKEMLGSSFDMEKCIGFNKWLKKQNIKSK
jgi:hypothetical protein